MKTLLRIAVLVALVWGLSKLVAHAPGGMTPGSVRSRRCRNGGVDWRSMRAGAGNTFVATGMQGEAIQTAGAAVAPVGRPLVQF